MEILVAALGIIAIVVLVGFVKHRERVREKNFRDELEKMRQSPPKLLPPRPRTINGRVRSHVPGSSHATTSNRHNDNNVATGFVVGDLLNPLNHINIVDSNESFTSDKAGSHDAGGSKNSCNSHSSCSGHSSCSSSSSCNSSSSCGGGGSD